MQGVTYILQDHRCLEFGFKVRVASHIGYKEIGPAKNEVSCVRLHIYIYISGKTDARKHSNT